MSPKEQCEELLNSILPHAEVLLEKNHEFYPIGEVLNIDGAVSATAFYDENEFPESNEVIKKLTEVHKELAKQEKILVSGIAWNAGITSNGKNEDAIIVSLEHKDGYSVVIGRTYKLGLFKKLKLGEIFAMEGKHNVFPCMVEE